MEKNTQQAVFGGGCFWCIEAAFERIPGVLDASSGYAGGNTENPSYEEVCSGGSGHAEVVKLEYDPEKVTFEQLLETFFKVHDPTQLNRQGADIGTQYRSVIYYMNEEQKTAATEFIKTLQDEVYEKPVVTELSPLETFYRAEAYHQDYYEKNPTAGYCAFVIRPKLKKAGLE